MGKARRISAVLLCMVALVLTGCLQSEAEKTQEAINLAAAQVSAKLDYLDKSLEAGGLRNANALKLYAKRMRELRPDQLAVIDAMAEQAEPGNSRIEGYRKRLQIAQTRRDALPGDNEDDAAFEEIEAIENAATIGIYNESLLDPINFLATLSDGKLRTQKVPPPEQGNPDQQALGAAGYLIGNEQYGRWESAEVVKSRTAEGQSALSVTAVEEPSVLDQPAPPAANDTESAASSEPEPSPTPYRSRSSGGGTLLWLWWPRYSGVSNAMRWNQPPGYANYHYGRPWTFHDSNGRELYGSRAERDRHTQARQSSDRMVRAYGSRTGRSAKSYDTKSNSRYSAGQSTTRARSGLSQRGARYNPRIKAAVRAASAASNSNKSSASKSTGSSSTRSTSSSSRSSGSSSFRSSGSSGRSSGFSFGGK